MQITLRNEGVDVQCVYLDNTLVSWCCRRHCHVLSSKLCLNVQERCLVGEEQYEIASDMKFMTRSNLSDCKAFMQFGPPSKTSCHAVPVKAFSHCAKNRHAHRYRKSTRRHSSKGEEVKRETVDEHFWSEVEAAQEELTRLEREREDSLRKGFPRPMCLLIFKRSSVRTVRRFSKRTDRLFCSISGLYGEALRQVKSGNEEEARKSLMVRVDFSMVVDGWMFLPVSDEGCDRSCDPHGTGESICALCTCEEA